MTGRPSSYTKDIAAEICAQIAEGSHLAKVCKADGMPHLRTVYRWLQDREEFSAAYDRARQVRAETWEGEIAEIADDTSQDFIDKTKPDGETYRAFDAEHVQRSKLRIDSRKWLMAKAAPKRFGEHLNIDQTSEVTVKQDLDLSHLTKRERDVWAGLVAKARAAAAKEFQK